MAGQDPEDVRQELLYLRKGPGFTPERFATCEHLQATLGGSSEAEPVLRERLESAIHSLRDEDAQMLLGVFAMDEATGGVAPLSARRDLLGQRLGLKREAVADRDASAIERLLTQLVTGWYPKSPTGIRIPESHNGFVQHAVRVQTLVRDRRHMETRQHYRLFALFDGVEYLTLATLHASPPSVLGDDFRVRTVQGSTGYLHQFWHHTPMSRGHTYDLRIRIKNPEPDEPYVLTEETMAFHEPTRVASFEVVFIGTLPAMIWRVEGLTAAERPGGPTKATRLEAGDSSAVRADFRDVYGGLYNGIAWDW
ncbi:hypothetical protein ACWDHH_15965 [Janibacter hoylei]